MFNLEFVLGYYLKVSKLEIENELQYFYCENCNSELYDKSKFCSLCGTKLIEKIENELIYKDIYDYEDEIDLNYIYILKYEDEQHDYLINGQNDEEISILLNRDVNDSLEFPKFSFEKSSKYYEDISKFLISKNHIVTLCFGILKNWY